MKPNPTLWIRSTPGHLPFAHVRLTILLLALVPALALAAERNLAEGHPASIRASVISTLESNPRIAQIKANRDAVRKDLDQTRGRYYPSVDLDLGYGTDNHSDALTRDTGRDDEWDGRTEASIALVQPLYHGGEIENAVNVQEAKLESAEHRVLDNAEAVALDAVIAHLEVCRQRSLLALSEQNVNTHQQIVAHITERQRAGAGSTADVYQANGRLTLTRTSLLEVKADLESAAATYFQVVGRKPDNLELPMDFRTNLPSSRTDAMEQATTCNPKLAAFAADIKAAEHEIEIRKSNFLPRINLEVSSTYRDQVESAETYEHNNAAMVRARWNLFRGGADAAARESAEARKRQTRLARNDEYNRIIEQITDTWNRYVIAAEQIRTYEDAVNFNQQTREAYQDQFIVGQRSLLDLLDAENELFRSASQLVTARVNEIIASYRLIALTGCLIHSLDIDTANYQFRSDAQVCCQR